MSESDIIQLAERLGTSIADSPQADKMRQARQALQADEQAVKLLQDYRQQADKVAYDRGTERKTFSSFLSGRYLHHKEVRRHRTWPHYQQTSGQHDGGGDMG